MSNLFKQPGKALADTNHHASFATTTYFALQLDWLVYASKLRTNVAQEFALRFHVSAANPVMRSQGLSKYVSPCAY